MKHSIFIIALLFPLCMEAQSLTLDECQRLARENYPSIRQLGFIEKSNQFSIENARTAYLPQIILSTQATYQNAVTEFPAEMKAAYQKMGITMNGINKDQYRIAAEVTQTIWDGGTTKAKNEITNAGSEAEKQQIEVELYNVKDRVNSLFFGILILEAQKKENLNMQQLLKTNCEKIHTMIVNHTALQSDYDAIRAEWIASRQQLLHITLTSKSYHQMLGLFIHRDITNAQLEMPTPTTYDSQTVNRPELQLYDRKLDQLSAKRKAIYASLYPQVGAFVQGYYGNPGYNLFKDMIENKWTLNGMIGIRVRWNICNLYTKKRDLAKLDIAGQSIEVQRQTFLFNNILATSKQQDAIEEMRKVITDDDEIIALRTSIRMASETKLDNGIINVNDLLRDITSENSSKIAKATHEIELLNRIYQLKNITNN